MKQWLKDSGLQTREDLRFTFATREEATRTEVKSSRIDGKNAARRIKAKVFLGHLADQEIRQEA